MKNIRHFFKITFLLTIAGFTFSACSEFDRTGLAPSTGGTNEILVCTNSNAYWNGKMGLTIQEFLAHEVPGLPQSESMFNLAHIPEDNLSKMLRIHHNVFIVDINADYKEAILETKKNLWSIPQRVVKMTVPSEEAFYEIFDENKEAIIELFNANERTRVNLAYGAIEDFKITKMLEKDYDIDILIPKSFYVATQEENFVWMRREAERFAQAILIYTYPYTDTIAFNYDRILEIRDSITHKHIPGPSDGSYMKIAMIEPPVAKRFDFNGQFAVETRGLWELEGDFMGGPFLSYTLVDERNNRVVTIDGYVYNPSQEKRDLLRQIEALLYTAHFPEVETDLAQTN